MRTLDSIGEVYHYLAEALAEPPLWMGRAGSEWPLFHAAMQMANEDGNSRIREVLADIAKIQPESLNARRKRYAALFDGGHDDIALYESLARDGRLAGVAMYTVANVYRTAGLSISGSELPDHASVELDFLAYLVSQEKTTDQEGFQWRKARRLFLKRHAGQWLPSLGASLGLTNDPVYAPVGRLLRIVTTLELRARKKPIKKRMTHSIPVMDIADHCSLCSFCAQVCPTQALSVREDQNTTALVAVDSSCVSCSRCVEVCPASLLHLEPVADFPEARILYESARSRCRGCGDVLVSEAELEEVARRLGSPNWLYYCSECRIGLREFG